MSTEKIRVLIVEPNELPYPVEMVNSLEAIQSVVGGYIEAVHIFDNQEIVLIANEEGKMRGMALNRAIYNDAGRIADIIAGTFIICATRAGEEDFSSLTDEEIKQYAQAFAIRETFIPFTNEIMVVRTDFEDGPKHADSLDLAYYAE